jgi:hypothetical protein
LTNKTFCLKYTLHQEIGLAPSPSQAIFERAEVLAAALARDLDRCAAIHAVMARELDAYS